MFFFSFRAPYSHLNEPTVCVYTIGSDRERFVLYPSQGIVLARIENSSLSETRTACTHWNKLTVCLYYLQYNFSTAVLHLTFMSLPLFICILFPSQFLRGERGNLRNLNCKAPLRILRGRFLRGKPFIYYFNRNASPQVNLYCPNN